MTDRLYYTDSYRTDFEAIIADASDGGRRVYLDRTAFYPTSGGQPHDSGQLGGAQVLDVVDEGERIAHLLAAPVATGGRVLGTIDWARRLDHMQQHTGQHLLSGVLAELFGYETVSVHFGRDSSTLDLDAPSLTPEQIATAEGRANAVATENRPVSVTFEDAATATGLRKSPTRQGTIRIVTIQDLDRSACGGTHLRATGEIGAILIRKVERVKQTMRLEFVCGLRAVRHAGAEHELLSRLSGLASAGVDELAAIFEKQRTELKQADTMRRELETKLGAYRARELYDATAADAVGLRRIVVREDGASLESLRGLAQACAGLPRTVFVGLSGAVPGLVVAASEDAGLDAGAALKAGLAAAGGRGGGGPRLAQGTVATPDALDAVVRYLLGAGTDGGASAKSP